MSDDQGRPDGSGEQADDETRPLSFEPPAEQNRPTTPEAPGAAAPGVAPGHEPWAPPYGPTADAPAPRPWDDFVTDPAASPAAPTAAPTPVAGWAPAPGPLPVFPGAEAPRHAQPRGRVGRWLVPTLVALALVVGVAGGLGGAALYDRYDSDGLGTVAGGLDDVDTVTLPPVDLSDSSVAAVAEELLPSTVQISAEFQGQSGAATGSGFVLDKQGHIITNNHVVESAAEDNGPIEVVDQDGTRYDATIVGRSPVYDLAVLFAPDATELRPAALGSSGQLRVGDGVVAFGSPLGLSSTVTAGIVSALRRPVTTGSTADDNSYINAVQTDAAINPGNSGGPLVNLRGQVVGVNSAIATNGGGTIDGQAGNIGVGFAIPVEQVRITADQILSTGEARYPVIGAQVTTGDDGTSDGASLQSILDGTPAAQAGLEKGDLVTEVDGVRVSDGISLIVSIRTHQPGETVEFTYVRDGVEQSAEVTLDGETG